MDIENSDIFTIPDQVYQKYEKQHHFFFDKAVENALVDGEVLPMIVLNKGVDQYFVPMLFRDEAEKEKALAVAKTIGFKLNSSHAFFFIEAWMSTQQGVKPSQAPDRVESIMCVLWVKDIGGAMITGEMIRDDHGNLIEVKKSKGKANCFGGMFTYLCGEDLPKKMKNAIKHKDLNELFDVEALKRNRLATKFKH